MMITNKTNHVHACGAFSVYVFDITRKCISRPNEHVRIPATKFTIKKSCFPIVLCFFYCLFFGFFNRFDVWCAVLAGYIVENYPKINHYLQPTLECILVLEPHFRK